MNETPKQLYQLTEPLLRWYDGSARVLPWRNEPTAYHVWVSEIMLQQTRVSAVLPYYRRFLEALPDVAALAEVEEEKLLKLWEGLGYYNRARNLQKAAKQIMEGHGGRFPEDYETILTLPGVGEYTAGAVASIAFGCRVSAVDGNVLRVVARITGDEGDVLDGKVKGRFRAWVEEIQDANRPGDFNQAMMELGATVCVPNGAPRCEVCPARAFCTARRENSWNVLPMKKKKAQRRIEEKTVFVLLHDGRAALHRRENKGLLAGLWEFPNVPGLLDETAAAAQLRHWGITPAEWEQQLEAKHIFTHVEWHMRGYVLRVKCGGSTPFLWADRTDFAARAVPSAFVKFTEAARERLSENGKEER